MEAHRKVDEAHHHVRNVFCGEREDRVRRHRAEAPTAVTHAPQGGRPVKRVRLTTGPTDLRPLCLGALAELSRPVSPDAIVDGAHEKTFVRPHPGVTLRACRSDKVWHAIQICLET